MGEIKMVHQNFTRGLIIAAISVAVLSATSCEDKDRAQLLKAQKCLDEINMDPNAAENAAAISAIKNSAQACAALVAGASGQQAAIVRCGAQSLAAGLTLNRIIIAYSKVAQSGTQNEAAYMLGLAVNTGANATENSSIANALFNACEETEIDSMIQLASFSRMGTILASANTGTCDPTSPPDTYAACLQNGSNATSMINACATTPASCDQEAIGETALVLSETYCNGENAQTEACNEISQAVAAGGDASTIGAALLNLLNQP